MTYYAQIGPDSKVLRVVVCDDPQWLADRLGGTWVETVIDGPDEHYAGPGMYDSEDICAERFIYEWRQPTHAENAYEQGAWVWHNGRAWRSLTPANTWEPGVSAWREMLVAWPEWVQPTGAHDAYQQGEKVSFAGGRYISQIDNNVWAPNAYPQGWQLLALGNYHK